MSVLTAARLATIALALNTAQTSAEITALLRTQCYGAADFALGEARLVAATQAVADQASVEGYRAAATSATRAARAAARDAYQLFAGVVRGLLSHEPALLGMLGLNHRMPRRTVPFLAAARQLFVGAQLHAAIAPQVARRSYDRAALARELAGLDQLAMLHHAQLRAITMSYTVAAEQSVALAELERWFGEFHSVACVALGQRRPLLEALGLVGQPVGAAQLTETD